MRGPSCKRKASLWLDLIRPATSSVRGMHKHETWMLGASPGKVPILANVKANRLLGGGLERGVEGLPIRQTVGGAIHDASGRQTIWRHRVCRQRDARHAIPPRRRMLLHDLLPPTRDNPSALNRLSRPTSRASAPLHAFPILQTGWKLLDFLRLIFAVFVKLA